MVAIIVAFDKNRVMGNSKTNKLPDWVLPSDMGHFRRTTEGHIVIMGKKTSLSIDDNYWPLKKRINIVLSRNRNHVPRNKNDDSCPCTSIENALLLADEKAVGEDNIQKDIFFTGGEDIYKQVLEMVEKIPSLKIYATEVDGEFEGDLFFPELSPLNWRIIESTHYPADEKNSHSFTINVYQYFPVTI